MAPSLLLSFSRKPRAPTTTAPAPTDNCVSGEKARFKETQQSAQVQEHNQQQQRCQEWAPSQVIRLQRIERESFRAEERIRNSVLEANVQAQNDNNSNEEDEVEPGERAATKASLEAQDEIQDFDVDEVFHLSPATCPNMRGDPTPLLVTPEASSRRFRDASNNSSTTDESSSEVEAYTEDEDPAKAPKLKIFTGSWNMAAKDPFADEKGQYVGDAMAALSLAEFLPPGYDLYVLGTQEKVTKHLSSAVLARLNSMAKAQGGSSSLRYIRLGLNAQPMECKSAKPSSSASSVPPSPVANHRPRRANNSDFNSSFISDSVLRASSFGLTSSSFVSSSCSGIGGLSSSCIDSEATATKTKDSEALPGTPKTHRQHRSACEVRGRGDGAFLHSKSTSIAIYVAEHLKSSIEVLRVGAHKFSLTSGSKGGLAVMLRVAGDQTITLVNCHLEANRPALRRQQLATLVTKLPKAMGFDEDDDGKMNLATCSDHVIWMGDFNYRIHSLDGETVLKLLGSNRHMELHDRYDSMQDDVAFVSGMQRFKEPRKWPSFYPTYKKLPNRPSCVPIENNPAWPLQVYRVRYKEPFYKGGRVKARVPGWCDRILHCSAPAWQSYLEVEQVPCSEQVHADRGSVSDGQKNHEMSSSSMLMRENYRSVNDALRGSDHSPVFCTFVWTAGVGKVGNQPGQ
ncbi:hypothetical protein Gpo141_00013733 [Globisporangium polare]